MQQMQTFTTSDPYHQASSRCAATGNLGVGTIVSGGAGKHYKCNNYNNFNNYVHGEQPNMTRIVFNGNNNTRSDYHCTTDNFQSGCIAGELIDNSGNYQLNFVNANGNMRYMRQQMNPSFHGDNQMQRCYIQRTQGQQARFVRIQQGPKMRPNNTLYRNFNNQQRQKHNRRFNTKGFNNYKNQNNAGGGPSVGFFEEDVVGSGSSPNRFVQQQQMDVPENETVRKIPSGRSRQESQQSKSEGSHVASNTLHSYSRSTNPCSTNGDKLLKPKVEYLNRSAQDLSYDDISENSDDNDSDLRERLSRKIIKREPGELDSEEEETEARQRGASNKRKSRKRHDTEDASKKYKSSTATSSNEMEGQNKDLKRTQKSGRKNSSHGGPSYSFHDNNRCSPSQNDSKASGESKVQKSHYCPTSSSYNSTYPDCESQNYCCLEGEVANLKDKVSSMKQSLREAQDKLLETNVVGSKKNLRLQEEIVQLKKQLEEATKAENELKTSLKSVESALSTKTTELTKMTLLNEVERQDKAKLNAEMSRTYKERLAIEVEKLRALFDVEVAKMQAFYMSSNVYDDETGVPFADVSADGNQSDHSLQNDTRGTSRNGEISSAGDGHGTSDVSPQHEIPFLQNYFDPSSHHHTVATTPFSLFENVMAYNSLIRHQHIYAHNVASSNSNMNNSETVRSHCASNSGM